jgi:hypothetical protein
MRKEARLFFFVNKKEAKKTLLASWDGDRGQF